MAAFDPDQLRDRVTALERALRTTQEDVTLLKQQARRARARGPAAFVAAIIALVSGGAIEHAAATSADDQTVMAPFTVTSSTGARLFQVRESDGGVAAVLYDVSGTAVGGMKSETGGGILVINNSSGSPVVQLGADNDNDGALVLRDSSRRLLADLRRGPHGGQGLGVYSNGELRAEILGIHEIGQVSVRSNAHNTAELRSDTGLRIRDEQGAMVVEAKVNISGNGSVWTHSKSDPTTGAAIGVDDRGPAFAADAGGKVILFGGRSDDGGGMLLVRDSEGAPAAGLQTYGGGKGQISIFNKAGTSIAQLSESDKVAGSGNVTVTDPAGNGVFSAGYTGTEGAACVNVKSGLWCMGKNLPLAMR